MASLLRSVLAPRDPTPQRAVSTIDDYIAAVSSMVYAGNVYPYGGAAMGVQQTQVGETVDPPGNDLVAYATELRASNGVVYACTAVRQLIFSAIRFQFQMFNKGRPSELWGDPRLQLFEEPWGPGSTTQDLLARTIQDIDLAGNAYWALIDGELVRLRPDWVEIALQPRMVRGAQVGWRRVGYIYWEGGRYADNDPAIFTTSEVAHYAPDPDPLASYRGRSWLTSVVQEVMADKLMGRHKQKFFTQGATPNLAVTVDKEVSKKAMDVLAAQMEISHSGVENAYRTLFLGGGADIKVIGADFQQMDFKTVQGHGETRIAAAAQVPPIIVGLSEGLESATYSNYALARRRFADGTMHPLWQNVAGTFGRLVPPPSGSRMWYDARGIPFLREDETDSAQIQAAQASTINTLITAGFVPTTVVKAVTAGDWALLQHSGLTSVQLTPPADSQPSTGPSDQPASDAAANQSTEANP